MIPQPNVKTAILVNAEGRPTVHRYTRTERVHVTIREELADASIRERDALGFAFLFECQETGVERRWGIQ